MESLASPPRTPVGMWPSIHQPRAQRQQQQQQTPAAGVVDVTPPSTPAPSPRPGSLHRDEQLRVKTLAKEVVHGLSSSGRQALLELIIAESTPQLLSPLLDLIQARLKRDFLKELPLELALHVLSFVDDVKTLARASAVSKFWRALLEDESTWKRMCWKSGFASSTSAKSTNSRSMRHLEFGARDEDDENSTPAGRERRATMGSASASRHLARLSLAENTTTSGNELRMSAWSKGLGVESPIASRRIVTAILNDHAISDSSSDTTADTSAGEVQSLPATPGPSMRSTNEFSYKNHFKRAYLTESNWLHGPGRLLNTQVSAEDAVVTSLGFDSEFIVIGMATNKIHVFRAKDGKYVRTLEGPDGVWCLVLVSRSSSPSLSTGSPNASRARAHRRNSFPSFDGAAQDDGDSSGRRRTRTTGGMGLGAGGETGDSAQQANVCGTARGWGQSYPVVVSAGCDREVRVWNIDTGECTKVLRGHTSTVRCMRVLNGRPVAVSGSRDATLRVWDIEKGTNLRVLTGHEHSVRCIEVHGNKVVSGSYDTTCRLWNVDTGECFFVFRGHQHYIYAVAFDGQRIVTGSSDSTVRIWDATTGDPLALLQGHTSLVGQLHLDPVANVLVTGGSDGRVIVFDLDHFAASGSTGSAAAPRFRLSAHDNSVTCLQFDDRFVVTGGNDGRVKLWDFRDGRFVRELAEPCDVVWRVAIRDDKCVILCKRDGKTVMDVRTFRPTEREVFGSS